MPSYSVTNCIYIPGNRDFVFIIIVQFMTSSNSRIHFVDHIRLFVHNITSLSSLCKLIWRHWTFQIYLSSVWVRLSIFSQLSIIWYMGLCVFSLPISTVMIEIIYTLSYYHHQIGSMNYYPLFRVRWLRSWNNGARCMFLDILMPHLICIINIMVPFGFGGAQLDQQWLSIWIQKRY